MLAGSLLPALREPKTAVLGASFTRDEPSTLGFPLGWYSIATRYYDLPAIASDGMQAVMPYHTSWEHVKPYLDEAEAAGVKVLVEVPRPIVRTVDTATITAFVEAHRSHPAVMGWYLADEPTITAALGPLSPTDAATAYATVKTADPSRPVAIAFATGEPAALYEPAMDVIMLDNYPLLVGTPEFARLDGWTIAMSNAARNALMENDFFPIVQAYGATERHTAFGRRFPTAAEERYMVYASVQMGATGMFFWAHDYSDPLWIDQVLRPIVADLNEMRPALAAGERPGLVGARHEAVRATAHRDPNTGETYIVAVHYGDGTVRAPITLRRGLRLKRVATLLGPTPRLVRIRNGYLPQTLGPYGVNVFRVR